MEFCRENFTHIVLAKVNTTSFENVRRIFPFAVSKGGVGVRSNMTQENLQKL